MKVMWFVSGFVVGLLTLSISIASVPPSRITSDSAIYDNVTEIKAPREKAPDFDSDISRLSAMEKHYRENPSSLSKRPNVATPMKRIAREQYRPQRAAMQAPARQAQAVQQAPARVAPAPGPALQKSVQKERRSRPSRFGS